MPRHALRAALVALTLLCSTRASLAQEARRTDVQLAMLGSPWFDGAYLSLGLGSLVVGTLALRPPDVHVAPLGGFGHHGQRAVVGRITDVVFIAGLGASLGLGASIEYFASGSEGVDVLRAPLVLGESVLMATGVVALLKNLVGACRPRAWDNTSRRCVGTAAGAQVREDRVSFPSGHTAPMAALAGASLGLWLLPERTRDEYIPLVLFTSALAVTNAVLRVVAGAHTWVDTSVGVVIGLGVGLGTAALHTASPSTEAGVRVSPVTLGYSGRF